MTQASRTVIRSGVVMPAAVGDGGGAGGEATGLPPVGQVGAQRWVADASTTVPSHDL